MPIKALPVIKTKKEISQISAVFVFYENLRLVKI
jgi:hypothetical protein